MKHITLQVLTWGTISAAVVSAFWLASFDTGASHFRGRALVGENARFALPVEAPAAGMVSVVDRPRASASAPAAR
jgi:hypothetical protein